MRRSILARVKFLSRLFTALKLDCRAGDARLDHLADQFRRHRVVMVRDLDVIIGRDAGPQLMCLFALFARLGLLF
jgi:hypothetical protein